MAAPDKAPRMADSRMHRTNCRPRICPTSRSSESNRVFIAPERNMISPMRMKSGTAASVPLVAVVNILFREHAEAGWAGQRKQADQIENQEADESRQSGDEQEQQQRSAGGDREPPCHCESISGDGVESGSSASRRKYSALLSNP